MLEGETGLHSLKHPYAEEILSLPELDRWQGMHFEKRRNEFLLGRYIAKRLLTSRKFAWAEEQYHAIQILNEEEGAPYLGTSGMKGSLSISHRSGFAAVAYSHHSQCHIGIDIELVESRNWSFVEDFFTHQEAQFVKSLPIAQQQVWVTLVWSAKEAMLKAWRQGLRIDTRSVEIQPIPEERLGLLNQEWVTIDSQVRVPEYSPCLLFGRVIGGLVLTLAMTRPWGLKTSDQIELIRVEG
jgi:4'-phosphopantetheinyl transferase